MTDDAWAYRVVPVRGGRRPGAQQIFIEAHRPWQNGEVERLDRTLATEWAHRRSSPPTPSAPPPVPPGSSTTTLDAATPPSAGSHPPVGCYRPDGRVHLARQRLRPAAQGTAGRPAAGAPRRRSRTNSPAATRVMGLHVGAADRGRPAARPPVRSVVEGPRSPVPGSSTRCGSRGQDRGLRRGCSGPAPPAIAPGHLEHGWGPQPSPRGRPPAGPPRRRRPPPRRVTAVGGVLRWGQ